MTRTRSLSVLVLTLLVVSALHGGEESAPPTDVPFKSIEFCVNNAAYKTVESSGAMEGSHMSGPPEAPRIFMEEATMKPEDLAKLSKLVTSLQARTTPLPLNEPDSTKPVTFLRITITLPDGTQMVQYTTPKKHFPTPEIQGIRMIMLSYRVGAW